MLQGRQFFSWEIEPVLDAVMQVSPDMGVVGLKLEVDSQVQKDQTDATPPSYGSSSGLWRRVDAAISPYANVPGVRAAVAALPVDRSGPGWVKPAAVAGGVVGAVALLYYWVRR